MESNLWYRGSQLYGKSNNTLRCCKVPCGNCPFPWSHLVHRPAVLSPYLQANTAIGHRSQGSPLHPLPGNHRRYCNHPCLFRTISFQRNSHGAAQCVPKAGLHALLRSAVAYTGPRLNCRRSSGHSGGNHRIHEVKLQRILGRSGFDNGPDV